MLLLIHFNEAFQKRVIELCAIYGEAVFCYLDFGTDCTKNNISDRAFFADMSEQPLDDVFVSTRVLEICLPWSTILDYNKFWLC